MLKNNLLNLFFCILLIVYPGFKSIAAPSDGSRLVGRVLEEGKGEPAYFATVALLKPDSSVVTGISADENGVFTLAGIKPGNYLLRVSLVGYDSKVVPNVVVPVEVGTIDLGVIYLQASSQNLDEVVITAERSMIVTDIDKTTITIGEDMLAASNTASDLLEKLPAVSVDENGAPMIRGKTNIVVLIDGKPSTLYGSDLATVLQTFPADLIDRIDVITTPSAKYEADGASGVIDIITKKATITGINGNGRLSLGTYNTHNANGNINYKGGKWVVRGSLNYQQNEVYNTRNLERLNLRSELPSTLFQEGTGSSKSRNFFGRIGANYDFDEKNSLGFSINHSRNANDNFSSTANETVLSDGGITQKFLRVNNGESDGDNNSYSLDYRRVFSESNHNLTVMVNYSTGNSDGRSEMEQQSDFDEWRRNQYSVRDNQSNTFYGKVDFSWPVNKMLTVETGAHTRHNQRQNINNLYLYSVESQDYDLDDRLSNRFGYSDALISGYATATQKWNGWGVRLGLRLSNMTQHMDQISMDRKFSVHFLNFIPSLSVSRKIGENDMFRLNYSRKVQRPQADWLNPFTDVADPRNIRTGNPDLKPEFVHKMELGYSNYQDIFGVGTRFFSDFSNNAITNLRTIDAEGVSYSRFDNIGRELSYGIDSDFSWKINPKVKLNASGRFFRTEVVSRLAEIDNRRWSYSGNINGYFHLPLNLRGSAYVSYEGPRAIAQGRRSGVFVANMTLRKDFMERKMIVSLTAQDLFLTRVYKSYLKTPTYQQSSVWQRSNRYVGVAINYKFGKISAQRH